MIKRGVLIYLSVYLPICLSLLCFKGSISTACFDFVFFLLSLLLFFRGVVYVYVCFIYTFICPISVFLCPTSSLPPFPLSLTPFPPSLTPFPHAHSPSLLSSLTPSLILSPRHAIQPPSLRSCKRSQTYVRACAAREGVGDGLVLQIDARTPYSSLRLSRDVTPVVLIEKFTVASCC